MTDTNNKNEKVKALVLLLFLGCIGITFVPPVCQDINYHHFADRNEYFSVPNFFNVISNLPFLIIGSLGILFVAFGNHRITKILQPNYFIFFVGSVVKNVY